MARHSRHHFLFLSKWCKQLLNPSLKQHAILQASHPFSCWTGAVWAVLLHGSYSHTALPLQLYTPTTLKPNVLCHHKMPLHNTLRQGALVFTTDGKTKHALKWFKLGKNLPFSDHHTSHFLRLVCRPSSGSSWKGTPLAKSKLLLKHRTSVPKTCSPPALPADKPRASLAATREHLCARGRFSSSS